MALRSDCAPQRCSIRLRVLQPLSSTKDESSLSGVQKKPPLSHFVGWTVLGSFSTPSPWRRSLLFISQSDRNFKISRGPRIMRDPPFCRRTGLSLSTGSDL